MNDRAFRQGNGQNWNVRTEERVHHRRLDIDVIKNVQSHSVIKYKSDNNLPSVASRTAATRNAAFNIYNDQTFFVHPR